jgi:hypothetical protein
MFSQLAKFQESPKKYPPIAMGTSDPYAPPAGGERNDCCRSSGEYVRLMSSVQSIRRGTP